MKRITRAQGELFKSHGARFRVECELDESVYIIGVNLFLYVQSGRHYLASTSDINALQWRKKLAYEGF